MASITFKEYSYDEKRIECEVGFDIPLSDKRSLGLVEEAIKDRAINLSTLYYLCDMTYELNKDYIAIIKAYKKVETFYHSQIEMSLEVDDTV